MNRHLQPYRQNLLLRASYSLIAPLYDIVIERAMRAARLRSLAALPADAGKRPCWRVPGREPPDWR